MKNRSHDTTFTDSNKELIILGRIIDSFRKYILPPLNANESGGVLLGYIYGDHDRIVKTSNPSVYDSWSPLTFNRSKDYAQKQINRCWQKSGGYMNYLGEWHTHPEKNPTPSSQDKSMIKDIVKHNKMQIDYAYLIIVGSNLDLWIGKQTKKGLVVLKKVLHQD